MKTLIADNLEVLKRFAAINRVITSTLDFEQSLELIAGSGRDLVGAAASLVLLRDRDDRLRIRASRGIDPSAAQGFLGPMGESVLEDLRRLLGVGDSWSIAASPIVSDRTLLGILVVLRDTPLDDEEAWLLSALADQAAISLGHARLHEKGISRELRLQEETTRSHRLVRELEAMIHAVAHDLRSPLRLMTSCSELLLEEPGEGLSGEQGRDHLRRIASGARKMDSLIHDLLTYSNLEQRALNLEPVDLEAAVSKALLELEPEIAGRSLVRVEAPLCRVLANRDALVMILKNLLSNAIKFVRPGETPAVLVQAQGLGDFVRVSVADAGMGIRAEYLERIFWVFERLNRAEAFSGTGIGLAIVRKGSERMGGRCGVESTEGKGSRFWVELRRA